eukprot:scaffold94762_cov62-Phaeocystis_antarctica.AAC.5
MVARHDRVGGVIGPPLAQQAPPAHTGAAARVEGHARSVEADRPFVALALRQIGHFLRRGRVCPARVVVEHYACGELLRFVRGDILRPWHRLVRQLNALPLVERVGLFPRLRVRLHLLCDLLHPLAVVCVEVAVPDGVGLRVG